MSLLGARFVAVEQRVRLEALDWGGACRPVALLAGSGNSAHIFDGFAPKLIDCRHVYGDGRSAFALYFDKAPFSFEIPQRNDFIAPHLAGRRLRRDPLGFCAVVALQLARSFINTLKIGPHTPDGKRAGSGSGDEAKVYFVPDRSGRAFGGQNEGDRWRPSTDKS
jgi:hypothetical protein